LVALQATGQRKADEAICVPEVPLVWTAEYRRLAEIVVYVANT